MLSDGVEIRLTDPIDRQTAESPESYAVSAWDLKRTANYGSQHYNQRTWKVTHAGLSEDGKTVRLTLPDLEPTWGMEIRCFWKDEHGRDVERRIHNTIHHAQQ